MTPPAWNVEAHHSHLVVDGARSKRDALALFAEWYETFPFSALFPRAANTTKRGNT